MNKLKILLNQLATKMITYYKQQLKEYLTTKQIQELDDKIKNEREWQNTYFCNRYREKCLWNVLQSYRNSSNK